MKIITIIGARPQIIKSSALSRQIRDCFSEKIEEIIVHTGQHYDSNMSEVFFEQLSIPKPKYNLGVGSASHGAQTAKMIEKIEEIILQEKPNALVIYGDTNSTLAAAIAASKIHVPIVHIEAGLRSFNKSMPEEINRIMADHVSTLLFSPTISGVNNLKNEGFDLRLSDNPTIDRPNVYHCGDIMYDNTIHFSSLIAGNSTENTSEYYNKYGKGFILCTIHRNANTDDAKRMNDIFSAILKISESERVILPLHPRTKKMLSSQLEENIYKAIMASKSIEIIEPVSFLDMIYLESASKLILTDSGGVQKEAYFLEKPCVILRPETEWVEIVENGSAKLVDANYDKIIQEVNFFLSNPPKNYPKIFGDAKASRFICEQMIKYL